MEGLADQFTSSSAIALVISSIIFIITIVLVAKQLISFLITCVLLFFAVVSGFAIANNDIVRDYLKLEKTDEVVPFETDKDSTVGVLKDRLWKIFEQLVETLSNQDEEEQSSERTDQVRSSVQDMINTLDLQRQKLQDYLDEHPEKRYSIYEPPQR